VSCYVCVLRVLCVVVLCLCVLCMWLCCVCGYVCDVCVRLSANIQCCALVDVVCVRIVCCVEGLQKDE